MSHVYKLVYSSILAAAHVHVTHRRVMFCDQISAIESAMDVWYVVLCSDYKTCAVL